MEGSFILKIDGTAAKAPSSDAPASASSSPDSSASKPKSSSATESKPKSSSATESKPKSSSAPKSKLQSSSATESKPKSSSATESKPKPAKMPSSAEVLLSAKSKPDSPIEVFLADKEFLDFTCGTPSEGGASKRPRDDAEPEKAADEPDAKRRSTLGLEFVSKISKASFLSYARAFTPVCTCMEDVKTRTDLVFSGITSCFLDVWNHPDYCKLRPCDIDWKSLETELPSFLIASNRMTYNIFLEKQILKPETGVNPAGAPWGNVVIQIAANMVSAELDEEAMAYRKEAVIRCGLITPKLLRDAKETALARGQKSVFIPKNTNKITIQEVVMGWKVPLGLYKVKYTINVL